MGTCVPAWCCTHLRVFVAQEEATNQEATREANADAAACCAQAAVKKLEDLRAAAQAKRLQAELPPGVNEVRTVKQFLALLDRADEDPTLKYTVRRGCTPEFTAVACTGRAHAHLIMK